MPVRVLRVDEMPFNVQVWVHDRDDGHSTVYMDDQLIKGQDVGALQSALDAVIGRHRLDASLVYATLRAVTG